MFSAFRSCGSLFSFIVPHTHNNNTQQQPGVARYKNMFSYNSRAAASFPPQSSDVMLNLVFDHQDLRTDSCVKILKRCGTNTFSRSTRQSLGELGTMEGSRRVLRREHLSSVDFLRLARVCVICESQLILRPYLEGRSMMHMLYKVVRA